MPGRGEIDQLEVGPHCNGVPAEVQANWRAHFFLKMTFDNLIGLAICSFSLTVFQHFLSFEIICLHQKL